MVFTEGFVDIQYSIIDSLIYTTFYSINIVEKKMDIQKNPLCKNVRLYTK